MRGHSTRRRLTLVLWPVRYVNAKCSELLLYRITHTEMIMEVWGTDTGLQHVYAIGCILNEESSPYASGIAVYVPGEAIPLSTVLPTTRARHAAPP
jgi:hypothetical protein